jgi:uncharacterized protein
VNIIGRKEEQQEFTDIYGSKKAEFAVVYGRRRIGKTFLIEQFFCSRDCVFFHVTGVQDGLLKEQLAEFAKTIGKVFYNGAKIETATSWMQAFEELNNAIIKLSGTNKIVIFIDELPWMATKRSRILQALDYYWNHYWSKNKRLKLIICGSSASWIIKNIIYNKGGLHNRYTLSLLIKPFSLHETKEFLASRNIKISNKQILQLYMAIGGVPHYLDKVKKGLSAAQNIDQLCFSENGILFSEFEKLFKSLFDDAKVYIELIRIISRVKEGIIRSDIEEHSKLTKKGGTLTDRLNDLEQAGFIKSFLPFKHQRQGIYYRVIDEYVYFYLRWIEPKKQMLLSNQSGNDYWAHHVHSSQYCSWLGYSFESICYKHISQIQKSLKIPLGSKAGTWRFNPKRHSKEKGAQIDLLFERNDDAVTICEIKYTDKPFLIDKTYYDNLINKIDVYKKISKTSKQIFIAFISANGIKKSAYANCINGLVSLDDLFI